jgi:O-methyltransferase
MNPLRIGRKLGKALLDRDAREKYEARFGLLWELADRWGFALYTFNLAWLEDRDFERAWSSFPARDVRVHDRKFVLYSMARSVADLDGHTAECGVFVGGSSHLMCEAMARDGREHHVFDSFEGLSDPEAIDRPAKAETFQWKKHDLATPVEVVRRNLSRFPRVYLHAGWIPEKFHEVKDLRFAMVHVDVDLYQPTLDSIAFFYERMVPGGILLCDDYGSTGCPGAKKAFDEFVAEKPEHHVVHLPTGQGFIVKR